MEIQETALPGVMLLRPKRFGDDRGWFAEFFNGPRFGEAGLPERFVQDNQSFSRRGVLRGHIWDVAVDLRRGSAHFGQWAGFDLRPLNAAGEPEMLWIPEGFGHGFLVMSETAEVLYKTTDLYHPEGERTVLWNDPELGIAWPLEALDGAEVLVSGKDAVGRRLGEAELPEFGL